MLKTAKLSRLFRFLKGPVTKCPVLDKIDHLNAGLVTFNNYSTPPNTKPRAVFELHLMPVPGI
jgi:hypothetical protein